MAGRKKSFAEDLNNPAFAFISENEPEKKEDPAADAPGKVPEETLQKYIEALNRAGYTLKPEGKTRRVQLVMTESLYSAAQEHIKGRVDPVTGRNLSFNQYISNLIENDVFKGTQEK